MSEFKYDNTRDALLKAASFIEAQDVEITTLREKVAHIERLEKARELVIKMVDRTMVDPEAANDEIKKLASSKENLDDLDRLVEMMAKQASPWSQSDIPDAGIDAVLARDNYIMSGELPSK